MQSKNDVAAAGEASPSLPINYSTRLFVQNLLLGFVESAALLLPSPKHFSSTNMVGKTPDDEQQQQQLGSYAATIRGILSAVLNQDRLRSPQQQLQQPVFLDPEVIAAGTLQDAALFSTLPFEARLVPSPLLSPGPETLRFALRTRLNELGLNDALLPPAATAASSSPGAAAAAQHHERQEETVAVARSLSAVAFHFGGVAQFRAVAELLDDTLLEEEDTSRSGTIDALRLGRIFDLFLELTVKAVEKKEMSGAFSGAAAGGASRHGSEEGTSSQAGDDEDDVATTTPTPTPTTKQHTQHEDDVRSTQLLRAVVTESLPWRLALQLLAQRVGQLFTAASWERLVCDQLVPQDASTPSQQRLSCVADLSRLLLVDRNDDSSKLDAMKTAHVLRIALFVSVFVSSCSASTAVTDKGGGGQHQEKHQEELHKKLVRFGVQHVFSCRDPALAEVIVSLLISSSSSTSDDASDGASDVSPLQLLASVMQDRAKEHSDKMVELFFSTGSLSQSLLKHDQDDHDGNNNRKDQQQQERRSIPSQSAWRDLCLAAALSNCSSANDGDTDDAENAAQLPADGTLPALLCDALVDEIKRRASAAAPLSGNEQAELIDGVIQLISSSGSNKNHDIHSAAHPSPSSSCSTLAPVALVMAARVFLNANGCFAFFRETADTLCLEQHLRLLGAVTDSCRDLLQAVAEQHQHQQKPKQQAAETSNMDKDSLTIVADQKTLDVLGDAVTNLRIATELAKAFREVSAEGATPVRGGGGDGGGATPSRSSSQHRRPNSKRRGICGCSAFQRVMRPFLRKSSGNMAKRASSFDLQTPPTSPSKHYDCSLPTSAADREEEEEEEEEAWLLCYLLTSRCNTVNLLDSDSCEQVHRALLLAIAKLDDASVNCRLLSAERVVVSCAVSLQKLSAVPSLVDSSSSLITEVSHVCEVLQKGKSTLPRYVLSHGDLVDSVITTIVSVLLQPFFSQDVVSQPDELLAKRCSTFDALWRQLHAQVTRSGFAVGAGVVRGAQQALGRVSLVAKIPAGELRRSIMVADTAELLGRAAESGTEEVLRALLSTLVSASDEGHDAGGKNGKGVDEAVDSTLESAFTTWHLERAITTRGGGGTKRSGNSSASPLEAAADFLGHGDMLLSIIRRATDLEQGDDAVLSLVSSLAAKSTATAVNNAVSGALQLNARPEVAALPLVRRLPFQVLYQRLANPFVRCDLGGVTDALETQTRAVKILNSSSGSSSSGTNSDGGSVEGAGADSAEFSSIETLEELVNALTPLLSSTQQQQQQQQQGLLSTYVWQGLAAAPKTKSSTATPLSSPLHVLVEHIVSCSGTIKKLGQGRLLAHTKLLRTHAAAAAKVNSLDDVVRLLHSCLIRAIITYHQEEEQQEQQEEQKQKFPTIWSDTSSSSSGSTSNSQSSACLLKPVSIVLIILQHLDSMIKRHVEHFFAQQKKQQLQPQQQQQQHGEGTATTAEKEEDDFDDAVAQPEHIAALLGLAAKCLECVQPQQSTAAAATTTSTTLLSQDALCVGVLRRVGSLASPSSLTLVKSLFSRFSEQYPAVRLQLDFIERRLEMQRRFELCRAACEQVIAAAPPMSPNTAAAVQQQDAAARESSSSSVQQVLFPTSKTPPAGAAAAAAGGVVSQTDIPIFSPVMSLLFMIWPRVADNEVAPSWSFLMNRLLDAFDSNSSRVHASILSMCDQLVPFAEIVEWCPSTFSNAARGASGADDKGDTLRMQCAFALCLASLSKRRHQEASNDADGGGAESAAAAAAANSPPRQEHEHQQNKLRLAETFLRQIVRSDLLAEVAMPGSVLTPSGPTTTASTTSVVAASTYSGTPTTNSVGATSPPPASVSSTPPSAGSTPASRAKAAATSKAVSRSHQERITKSCGRAIHVALPVESILALYRCVLSANPGMVAQVQAAVLRTRRFGTLRRALQRCVAPSSSSAAAFATTTSSNDTAQNEKEKENTAQQLQHQVRELDLSAVPAPLLDTLRRRLLRAREFDTLAALFDEIIHADPDKRTLETAVDALCITHAQKIVYAYMLALKLQRQQKQKQEQKLQKQKSLSHLPLAQQQQQQQQQQGSTLFAQQQQQQQQIIDPGFAALQVFSAFHRSLYQSCQGEMDAARGSFPSAASLQVRVVGLVLQGCQPSAQKQQQQHQQRKKEAEHDTVDDDGDQELISTVFPTSIFSSLSTTDWFNVAFRLLTFVTESSALQKYFVGDAKWKRSLLGIATMRAVAAVAVEQDEEERQRLAGLVASAPKGSQAQQAALAAQQNQKPSELASLFSPSVFLAEPLLVVENLVMCCRLDEAQRVMRQVPSLNCDELIMQYALKAASIERLASVDNDLFPFGCRVSGVEPSEENFLFPLDTELQLRILPRNSAAERERIREGFLFSKHPCLALHCALSDMCRDVAFRFRSCFDFSVLVYDNVATACDRPPFQDLLVDIGSRALEAAVAAAKDAGVFHEDPTAAQEAVLLSALFHVARMMLVAGDERFPTFDRFQDPDTRSLAVQDLVFDLLDAGLTSAAAHVALSTAGLVDRLDAVWLAEATRLAALGLVEEAAAAVERLDPAQGARGDTAQILIPLIENSPSAGLVGCYGAVRRDIFYSPRQAAAVSRAKGSSTNKNNNNQQQQQPQQEGEQNQDDDLAAAALLDSSNNPQHKYILARTDTLDLADKAKMLRESVVSSMVKEFCGVQGTVQLLVRQGRVAESVRVALAAVGVAGMTPLGYASAVFFDRSLLFRNEIHEQLRSAMKQADPTLAVCRPFIRAVFRKLENAVQVAASGGGPGRPSAGAVSEAEARNSSINNVSILRKQQLQWMKWSHDHAVASRVALSVAGDAPSYEKSLEMIDVAEEHATLSKQQPTGSWEEEEEEERKVEDTKKDHLHHQPEKKSEQQQQQQQQQRRREEEQEGRENKNLHDEDDDDESAFAPDGVKYPPCRVDVMERMSLLGRLRIQRSLTKLLAAAGTKVHLGWYDVVTLDAVGDSVRRLASTMYRDADIMSVVIKALVAVNQPSAPTLTTALLQAKQASRQDMALGFAKVLVASPALPASDRDATLLECIRVLGPVVASGSVDSKVSTLTGRTGSGSTVMADIDAAVDSISTDNYAHRCLAMIACGRLQDAYKCAAVEAESIQLVQEVMNRCQGQSMSKNKNAKSVAEMCGQWLRVAKQRQATGASAAASSSYDDY